MMKSWSRLCFLVLAISSLSSGLNGTTVSQPNEDYNNGTDSRDSSIETPASLSPGETKSETTSPSTSHTHTSTNVIDVSSTNFMDSNVSTAAQTTTVGVPGSRREDERTNTMTTVSMATASTSSKPVTIEDKDYSSWGYVVLVLIILVIITLCIILYFLRRVSRTYSFDLQRPVPNNNLIEPIGTFEPVYLDDLDQLAPKDQVTRDDPSPPPVANGTTPQSEEKSSNGSNASQEQPDTNGLEASLTSNTSPSLGEDPAEKTSSPLSGLNLFFDAAGEEQQAENNNSPSICSSDPFVEINLDDPAWSDQLLTSPEAPSSVLPFSPSSFSSSSS